MMALQGFMGAEQPETKRRWNCKAGEGKSLLGYKNHSAL